MTLSRALPRIRFEAQPRPVRDALPRMDIAVFAGFAAAGPLHLPVAVEDPGQYAMLFGEDVALPRPFGAKDQRYAHLGSAVRAFFAGGGRRCWVIRIAGENAVANRFRVPGLQTVDHADVYAYARAEGSWSDALRVQTNLNVKVLRAASYDLASDTLTIAAGSTRELVVGDLVRVSWRPADVAVYLFVESVRAVAGKVEVTGTTSWFTGSSPEGKPLALPSPSGTIAAERLTFDLTVRSETDPPLKLKALGFAPLHPRYFGGVPSDWVLFEDPSQFTDGSTPQFRPARRMDGAPDEGWPDLWREAATPRYPLAKLTDTKQFDPALFLPIGMTSFFSEEAERESVAGTTFERDGLETFSTTLFLDPNLADAEVFDLLARADSLRYEAEESLKGIHAAIGIEEATMLAAPDAVHPGWFRDVVAVPAPPQQIPAKPDESGKFVDCNLIDPLTVPVLQATIPNNGSFDLTWTLLGGAISELQEARKPDFSDAATIYAGTSHTFTLYGRAVGAYYYRVRQTVNGKTSDWSLGVVVSVTSASGFTGNDDKGELPDLLDFHAAMVKMCAARGDCMALLSLPRHYDEALTIAHATELSASVEPFHASFGALWHPWLTVLNDDLTLRSMPPDGPTAGVMAARANARGAWVAPANEPLRSVVALTPAIPETARQSLQDAAVNLIRHEPAGFLCLDADTLSTDEEVRPINVRRLLILVRRAALRAGNDYAFEPNGTGLSYAAKRGFESLLATMFARGAFAGRNAKSAYQVVTDETVNTQNSMDQGRFIALIKIAPSLPLTFLTVRLLQRADGALEVQ